MKKANDWNKNNKKYKRFPNFCKNIIVIQFVKYLYMQAKKFNNYKVSKHVLGL